MWSPDGRQVLFTKESNGAVYEKDADGVGEERQVYRRQGVTLYPSAVSQDRTLVLVTGRTNRRPDIMALPPAGSELVSTVSSRGLDVLGQVSPDGRWLAFASDERAGRRCTCSDSRPRPASCRCRRPAAADSPDGEPTGGNCDCFAEDDLTLMTAVAIEPDGDSLKLGPPRPLFRASQVVGGEGVPFFTYAISSDGQRFLVARPSATQNVAAVAAPLTVVLNWNAALR